jgi:hypothetical protein
VIIWLAQATRIDSGVNQLLQKKDVAIENVYFPEIPCIPLRNGVPDGFS